MASIDHLPLYSALPTDEPLIGFTQGLRADATAVVPRRIGEVIGEALASRSLGQPAAIPRGSAVSAAGGNM